MGCNGSKDEQAVDATVFAVNSPVDSREVQLPTILEVEIIEASGLPQGILPVCVLEVPGHENTRVQTGGAFSCDAKAVWGTKLKVQEYLSGCPLRLTLWSADMKKLLGEAKLSSEQARAGYLGDLVVSGPEFKAGATLRVNVDGSDANIAEKLTHVVAEVGEVALNSMTNTTKILGKASGGLEKTASRLQEEIREAADEAQELVQIESKKVSCNC